jgi:hypothetical protein
MAFPSPKNLIWRPKTGAGLTALDGFGSTPVFTATLSPFADLAGLHDFHGAFPLGISLAVIPN